MLTVVAVHLIQPTWLAALAAAATVVVVSYVLIGVGPRTVGRQHPYGIALVAAPVVRALATLLSPLTRLLILVGNAITPGRGFREGPFSSEVELRELVDLAGTSGVVDENERQMIHSVFELGDTTVRAVMVPRTDVVWVRRDWRVAEAMKLALDSGYSRLPVIGDSVDEVVGVAYLKDLVAAADDVAVADVMRPPVLVPDSKRIDELLKEMQRSRVHQAIVVDEYGGTAGVVTIEDILEEIVGEITDEYDADEQPPVQRIGEHECRVASRLPVSELAELYDADFGEVDVDTVGGLLAQRLGRVPLPGDEADVDGLRLRAEGSRDARGRLRVTSVLVSPVPAEEREEEPTRA
jgi:CBS domain containing-hemolysin-like protein